uniref:Uncharacterized protein n=1 Tax=Heterorhabditis bacteriophora TaxID=37862 RepID=A0A1I7X113_HETBA
MTSIPTPPVDVSDHFATASDIQTTPKSLPKNYLHMRNFRSNTTPRNIPSNSSVREVENTNHRRTDSIDGPRASSSASACSSLASSHRSMTTEDDSSSSFSQMSTLSSGPPIPPRHGVPSHVPPLNSADTFFPHYVLLDSPVVSTVRIPSSPQDISAPPAVDRSKKPAKLRLDGDDDRVPSEMTIHGYNKYGSSFIRTPRTPQLPKTTPKPRYSVDPPKAST